MRVEGRRTWAHRVICRCRRRALRLRIRCRGGLGPGEGGVSRFRTGLRRLDLDTMMMAVFVCGNSGCGLKIGDGGDDDVTAPGWFICYFPFGTRVAWQAGASAAYLTHFSHAPYYLHRSLVLLS